MINKQLTAHYPRVTVLPVDWKNFALNQYYYARSYTQDFIDFKYSKPESCIILHGNYVQINFISVSFVVSRYITTYRRSQCIIIYKPVVHVRCKRIGFEIMFHVPCSRKMFDSSCLICWLIGRMNYGFLWNSAMNTMLRTIEWLIWNFVFDTPIQR